MTCSGRSTNQHAAIADKEKNVDNVWVNGIRYGPGALRRWIGFSQVLRNQKCLEPCVLSYDAFV